MCRFLQAAVSTEALSLLATSQECHRDALPFNTKFAAALAVQKVPIVSQSRLLHPGGLNVQCVQQVLGCLWTAEASEFESCTVASQHIEARFVCAGSLGRLSCQSAALALGNIPPFSLARHNAQVWALIIGRSCQPLPCWLPQHCRGPFLSGPNVLWVKQRRLLDHGRLTQ